MLLLVLLLLPLPRGVWSLSWSRSLPFEGDSDSVLYIEPSTTWFGQFTVLAGHATSSVSCHDAILLVHYCAFFIRRM